MIHLNPLLCYSTFTMNFAQNFSYWVHAGQDAGFFKAYRKDIHSYTVSFASVFYKVMVIVFTIILITMLIAPETPQTERFRSLYPFVAIYMSYMAICLIIFETVVKRYITASLLFTQITLLLFGVLLLWLDIFDTEKLAVFLPVYFILFPMLVTLSVPILVLDTLILYVISVIVINVFKSPNIMTDDIISITICMVAGFFIGCKNTRSRLMEIKTNSREEKHNALQKSIIDTLIDDYDCLAMTDYDTDSIEIVLINDNFNTNTNTSLRIDSISRRTKEFVELDVHPDDRKRYSDFMSKENVLALSKMNSSFSINFRVMKDGTERYVQTKLTKDISAPIGSHRFILSHRSIDDEIKTEQMISNVMRLASQDSLTGVNNRTAFERDKEEIHDKLSSGELRQAGIVMFDVNWLKETNDLKGHKAGDELLKSVCSVICNIYKHSPVYRIGGDEFAVLMSSHDMKIRTELLEKAKRASSKTKDGISFAAGMAVFTTEDGTFEQTIKRADDEMYKMKKEIKRPYIAEER